VRRLQTEFVPAVADTHEVQTGRSAHREWFLAAARQVKPEVDKGVTAQGRYVVGADGTAYGYNNNRSVERVLAMMDSALGLFAAHSAGPVPAGGHPSGRTWPEGVQTVRVVARVRPVPPGCDPMNQNVARDHLWILPDEARALGRGDFPEALATRICRFSLVDNVRGEPDHWRADEVALSEFWPSGKGQFSGMFSMETADGKRGLRGTIEVEAETKSGKLSRFLAYASVQAWGRGTYTPGEPPGKFPMAIAMRLVDDEASRTVPPQAVSYGAEYLGR
jgi:hypothetical protein